MAKDQKQSKQEGAAQAAPDADQKQSKQEGAAVTGEQVTNDTPLGEGIQISDPLPLQGDETELPETTTEDNMNANKIMPDPIASLKKGNEPDEDDLASKLENAELQAALDTKRPLCEPSLRKGLHKLATYRVTRLDGKDELCCIEEVGPGYSYKTAVPLPL